MHAEIFPTRMSETMNPLPISRNQVREIDQIAIDQYGIPGIVLMENAGCGAAQRIHELVPTGQVVILCGKGNNGGDGYVVARHLQCWGHDVRIISVINPSLLKGDASINATIAQHAEIPICVVSESDDLVKCLSSAEVIVDGLLGTGATGPPRGILSALVSAANECDALRVSLDIPTGMDADSGEVSEPTFRADHTMTFVAAKIGFDQGEADRFTGKLHVIPIGVPPQLLEQLTGSI